MGKSTWFTWELRNGLENIPFIILSTHDGMSVLSNSSRYEYILVWKV